MDWQFFWFQNDIVCWNDPLSIKKSLVNGGQLKAQKEKRLNFAVHWVRDVSKSSEFAKRDLIDEVIFGVNLSIFGEGILVFAQQNCKLI